MATEADILTPICETRGEQGDQLAEQATNMSFSKHQSQADIHDGLLTVEGGIFLTPSLIVEAHCEGNNNAADVSKVTEKPDETVKYGSNVSEGECEQHKMSSKQEGCRNERDSEGVESELFESEKNTAEESHTESFAEDETPDRNLHENAGGYTEEKPIDAVETQKEIVEKEEQCGNLVDQATDISIAKLPNEQTMSVLESQELNVQVQTADEKIGDEKTTEEDISCKVLPKGECEENKMTSELEGLGDARNSEDYLEAELFESEKNTSTLLKEDTQIEEPGESLRVAPENIEASKLIDEAETQTEVLENFPTIVPNERMEETSFIQVDCPKMENLEHSEKDTEIPYLVEDSTEYVVEDEETKRAELFEEKNAENALLKEEMQTEKPVESLHAHDDIKASHLGRHTERQSLAETSMEVANDEASTILLEPKSDGDLREDAPVDHIASASSEDIETTCSLKEESLVMRDNIIDATVEKENVATEISHEHTEENSLTHDDCSQMEHMEKESENSSVAGAPLEETNANVPEDVFEPKNRGEDLIKAELESEGNTGSTLVKEEALVENPIDSMQVAPEDIDVPDSNQDENSFIKEKGITTYQHEISCDKSEKIPIEAANSNERSHEDIDDEDNSPIEENTSENPSLIEATTEKSKDDELTVLHEAKLVGENEENTLVKDVQVEKPIDSLQVGPEDVNASASCQETSSFEQKTVTADPQEISFDRAEDKIINAACIKKENLEGVVINVPSGDDEGNSPIEVDDSKKPSLEEASTGNTRNDESTVIHESIFADETIVKANDTNVGCVLVKEEESLEVENEDTKATASDLQKITGDHKDDKTIVTDLNEETPENRNFTTEVPHEHTEKNSVTEADCLQTDHKEYLEKDSENSFLTEASAEKDNADESKDIHELNDKGTDYIIAESENKENTESTSVTEEAQVEKPIDSLQPDSEIKASASSQDLNISIEEGVLTAYPQEISSDRTEKESIDAANMSKESLEGIATNIQDKGKEDYSPVEDDDSQKPPSKEVIGYNNEEESEVTPDARFVGQNEKNTECILVEEEEPIEPSQLAAQDINTRIYAQDKETISPEEQSLTTMEDKTSDATSAEEETAEDKQNIAKATSYEQIGENLVVQIDRSVPEQNEVLESDSGKTSFTEALRVDTADNILVKEVLVEDHHIGSSQEANEDIKTSASCKETSSTEEKILTADSQEISRDKAEEKTLDSAYTEKGSPQVFSYLMKDNEDNLPIEVDGSEKPSLKEASTGNHNDEESTAQEAEYEDKNNVKADLFQNEKNIECDLVKEEVSVKSLEVENEDIKATVSSQDREESHREEQCLVPDSEGIMGDNKEDKTFDVAELKEETLENKNEHSGKEGENTSLREAAMVDTATSVLVNKEAQVEDCTESSDVATEDIKAIVETEDISRNYTVEKTEDVLQDVRRGDNEDNSSTEEDGSQKPSLEEASTEDANDHESATKPETEFVEESLKRADLFEKEKPTEGSFVKEDISIESPKGAAEDIKTSSSSEDRETVTHEVQIPKTNPGGLMSEDKTIDPTDMQKETPKDEEKGSNSVAIKVPCTKDLDVNEDVAGHLAEEHTRTSNEKVPDVTSLASEASEQNNDHKVVEEVNTSGDKSDKGKIGVPDDGFIMIPTNETLAETDPRGSTETEVQVPDGEKNSELVPKDPETETDQRNIDEELLVDASPVVSESEGVNGEEEKTKSDNCKEVSGSSNSMELDEGSSSSTAIEEDSACNSFQESERETREEAENEEAQEQEEEVHVSALIQDSYIEKVEKDVQCVPSANDSKTIRETKELEEPLVPAPVENISETKECKESEVMEAETPEDKDIAKTTPYEDIEKNLLIQEDCSQAEQSNDLEKDSEITSLSESLIVNTTEGTLDKEAQVEKPINSLQVGPEDVKAFASCQETSSVEEKIPTADPQEVSSNRTEDKTYNAACTKKEKLEGVVINVPSRDDEDISPTEVDDSRKPSLEDASTGYTRNDESSIVDETNFADENNVNADFSENETNVGCKNNADESKDIHELNNKGIDSIKPESENKESTSVKEEAQQEKPIDSLQPDSEEIKASDSSQDLNISTEEGTLTAYPQEISSDKTEKEYIHAATTSEGSLENIAKTISYEQIGENLVAQVDRSRLEQNDVLKCDSDKISLTEAQTVDTTENILVKEEVQVEDDHHIESLQEANEDIKTSASCNETSSTDEKNLTADSQETSCDKEEEETTDSAYTEKESFEDNEDNLPIEVDGSKKPSLKEALTGNHNDDKSTITQEAEYEDENTSLTEAPIVDTTTSTLVNEEVLVEDNMESSEAATEDIKAIAPCQGTESVSVEEQVLIVDAEDISSNNTVEKTEVEDITEYVPRGDNEDNSPIEEDGSQKPSLEEASTEDAHDHESATTQEAEFVEESLKGADLFEKEKIEEGTLSIQSPEVEAEDIKASSSSEGREIVTHEEQIPKTHPGGLMSEDKTIDLTNMQKETPKDEVPEENENTNIKPTDIKPEEGECYINAPQMTTAANIAAHEEKDSNSGAAKNSYREDFDVAGHHAEEHKMTSNEKVSEVTSLASEASEQNDDHKVVEEATTCGGKTDTEKIGTLDDGFIVMPTKETLEETDPRGSMDAEVQVPDGEKEPELVKKDPETETDQRNIDEELLADAYRVVSDPEGVDEERIKSDNYKEESEVMEDAIRNNEQDNKAQSLLDHKKATEREEEEIESEQEKETLDENVETTESTSAAIANDFIPISPSETYKADNSIIERKVAQDGEELHIGKTAFENEQKTTSYEQIGENLVVQVDRSGLEQNEVLESDSEKSSLTEAPAVDTTENILDKEVQVEDHQIESLHEADEDIKTSASCKETSSTEEQILTADSQEISCDKAEEKTTDSAYTEKESFEDNEEVKTFGVDDLKEETPENKNEHSEKDGENTSLTEAPIVDTRTSILVSEEALVEDCMESSEVATGDFKVIAACQDAPYQEISSSAEERVLIVDTADISRNNTDENTEVENIAEDVQGGESGDNEDNSPTEEDGSRNPCLEEASTEDANDHESATAEGTEFEEASLKRADLVEKKKITEGTFVNEDISIELLKVAARDIKASSSSEDKETVTQEEQIPNTYPGGLMSEDKRIDQADMQKGTPKDEVAKEIENTNTEATNIEPEKGECYLNAPQMTTAVNIAAHEEKDSNSITVKIPCTKDLDVDEDVAGHLAEEHTMTSNEKVLDVTSLATEASGHFNDHKVVEEASTCGNNDSFVIPTNEALAETDQTGSTEAEVQVPNGEKEPELVQKDPETETDQRNIDKELLVDASWVVSESEGVNVEEEKSKSENCKEVSGSSNPVKLDEGSSPHVALEEDSTFNSSEESKRETKEEAEKGTLDKNVETTESTSVFVANDFIPISPSQSYKADNSITERELAQDREELHIGKTTFENEEKTINKVKDESSEQKLTDFSPATPDIMEARNQEVALLMSEAQEEIFTGKFTKETDDKTVDTTEGKVMKESTSLEGIVMDNRSVTDLKSKIDDEAPEIKETKPTATEGQDAEVISETGEQNSEYESKTQLLETVAKIKGCETVSEVEETKADEKNLEAAAEMKSGEQYEMTYGKEIMEHNITREKTKEEDEDVEDYRRGSCEEEVPKFSEEDKDKAPKEPEENILTNEAINEGLEEKEQVKRVEEAKTSLETEEANGLDITYVETRPQDSNEEINRSTVAFSEDKNNRTQADDTDYEMVRDEGSTYQNPYVPEIDADVRELPKGLDENIKCEAPPTNTVHETIEDSEAKKENSNTIMMRQQEEDSTSKHEMPPIPQLVQGKESDKQNQTAEFCRPDEVKAKVEESMMPSAGQNEEENEVVTWSNQNEDEEINKPSLSDLLHASKGETSQMKLSSTTEKEPTLHMEDLQAEKLNEAVHEDAEKDDEEETNEEKGSELISEAPVMVNMGDAYVKVSHKKPHNILSGVGSKVKHSIAKVKKVITGKSSHPKPPSPKKVITYEK